MKKVFLLFAAFCLAQVGNAQTKTYSSRDANLDGKVDISDVNTVVSDLLGKDGSTVRVVRVDAICTYLHTIDEDVAKKVETELGVEDPNVLTGKFSVSAKKQVQFTKSNLYWDGSAFKFEENQTDYQTSWDANHVSHFFWTNLTDYQSGTASYMPYAESYSYSSQSKYDKFWCGEDNPLTVEGTSGLYTLTGNALGEWDYLFNSRTNASSLHKCGVTVTNGGTSYTNCVIIAPDDFTGTLASSYTLDEVNAAGLVCLPAAGRRDGSSFDRGGSYGYYWTANYYPYESDKARSLTFTSSKTYHAETPVRSKGMSLRLVRNI